MMESWRALVNYCAWYISFHIF